MNLQQSAEVFVAFLPAIISTVFALLWWLSNVRASRAEDEARDLRQSLRSTRDALDSTIRSTQRVIDEKELTIRKLLSDKRESFTRNG